MVYFFFHGMIFGKNDSWHPRVMLSCEKIIILPQKAPHDFTISSCVIPKTGFGGAVELAKGLDI
jgi:hypothetical protein